MRNDSGVDCRGYGAKLTPWACLENQLSPMCLPGWPCEACEEAIGVATKGKEFYCANLEVAMSTGLCDAARLEAQRRSNVWPEGLGWLRICLECPVEATEIGAEVGRSPSGSTRSGAQELGSSGMLSLKSPKRKPIPKGMTRAVARDLGLI